MLGYYSKAGLAHCLRLGQPAPCKYASSFTRASGKLLPLRWSSPELTGAGHDVHQSALKVDLLPILPWLDFQLRAV